MRFPVHYACAVACAALLLFSLTLDDAHGADARAVAAYTVDLCDAADGRVRVSVELDGLPAGELALLGLLSDRLMDVSDLTLETADGVSLACEARSTAPAGDEAGLRFTVWRTEVPPGVGPLRLAYTVAPSRYLPPDGDRERRWLGFVGAEGCALSLPNVLVVPALRLDELRFAARLPRSWRAAVAPPELLVEESGDPVWSAALVAGPFFDSVDVAPGVRVTQLPGVPEGLIEAVGRLAAELERLLGPARADVHVVTAPCPAGNDGHAVELPGTVGAIAIDVRALDAGTLRRLLRRVIPRWLGRDAAELELDRSPDAWFALGVRELLAARLPADVGLVERDVAAEVEATALRGGWPSELDVESAGPSDRAAQRARRLAAQALVHELFASTSGRASPRDWLRDWDGRGLPSRRGLADLAADFVERVVRGGAEPSFRDRWHLQLEPAPIERDPTLRVARTLTVAFTADGGGYLETCGCKLSQSGGVARRAAALAELRRREPGAVVLDLGNFAPIEALEPSLDPIVAEECRLYVRAMEAMGYDAAAVGPDELYSGLGFLRRGHAASFPLVAAGLEIDGAAPYDPWTVVERPGLRLGFVGFSEHLDPGGLREAQERHLEGARFPTTLEALEAALRELRPRVDLLVVGGRLRPELVRRVADPRLGVDLVLVAGYSGFEREGGGLDASVGFLNGTAVAFDEVAQEGWNRLTLYLTPQGRVASADREDELLPRDAPVDEDVQELLEQFYAELGRRPELFDGLTPLFAWDDWHRGAYAGADACAACHTDEHRQWLGTSHATAMRTLVAARRDRHPKCVQCHVLGLGTETGYDLARPDERFAGVQCEACHGAGADHARAPRRDNIRRTPTPRTCLECHDEEHSDRFEERLDEAWAAILHR